MGLILPPSVIQAERERVAMEKIAASTPQCPAAEMGRYADSGQRYLHCKVERRHFAVSEAPTAVAAWCVDDYATCPVWRAWRDQDPALAKVHAAQNVARTRELEKGLRTPIDEALEGE